MRTIDITPTWQALLPAMLAVISDPEDSEQGRLAVINITGEFKRMAKAADNWNEYVKSERHVAEEHEK